MKTIKSLVLVAIMAVSTVVTASNPNAAENSKIENQKIGKEIQALLENPKIEVDEEIQTYAMVALTDNGELVVLSVESTNEAVQAYIKNRLNYKKIGCNYKGSDDLFKVPVRIKPGV